LNVLEWTRIDRDTRIKGRRMGTTKYLRVILYDITV